MAARRIVLQSDHFMNRSKIALCSIALFLICNVPACAADIWDAPAFSADPVAMLREAAAVPAGADVRAIVLLEECRFEFAADGRQKYTRHLVSRIVSKEGAENWSATEARWEPWHQSRPVIRARVITADGRVHTLDPKTIAEAPVMQDSADVFSDARTLKAPLPAVEAGAILEEESVVEDSAPKFQAGQHNWMVFGYGKAYPVRKSRLILESPPALPMNYRVHGLPDMKAQREERDGTVRLTFEAADLRDIPESEDLLPHDVFVRPRVAFSTGKSWADVAGSYSATVDRQIKGADLKRLLNGDPPKGTPREIASVLVARLRKEIRYAAVEFGDAAYVPRPPADVFQRRYGDCKDQAALLVALLRASGVPANVALLNIEAAVDPEADLPGFGQFDHAIVYVPGEKSFWIDPTDSNSDAGEIPKIEQGRVALVASPWTTDLRRIPESPSVDNRQVEVRDFYLAESGASRVVETSQAWGSRAHEFRSFEGSSEDKLKKDVANYVKNVYLSSDVTRVEVTHKSFELPAGLVIEAAKARRGSTSAVDAAVFVRLESVVSPLPKYFSQGLKEAEKGKEKDAEKSGRQHDLLLPESFVYEIRYRIHPPLGYGANEVPKAETRNWGQATFHQEYRLDTDGAVTALLRFDSGPRRMSAADAEALHKGVLDLNASKAVVLAFEQKGMTLLHGGKIREALDEFRALQKTHPQEAVHFGQIADAFLEAGLGDAARTAARQGVTLEPQSVAAHLELAWILRHDALGRDFRKGFDFDGAAAEYRQALKLEPDNSEAREDLAILLEHNKEGVRYAAGSHMAEALEEYKAVAKEIKDTGLAANPVFDLVWSGKYSEARQAAEELPASLNKNVLLLTAIAATDPSAAIREATTRFPEASERQSALANTGELLLKLRLYSAAGQLIGASAQGSASAAAVLSRANQIGQFHRIEDSKFPVDDPRSVVQNFFRIVMTTNLDRVAPELSQILSRYAQDQVLDIDDTEGVKSMARQARGAFSKVGLSPEVGLDLTVCGSPMVVEGDRAAGFRVQMQNPFAGSSTIMFVTSENGQLKFLDTGDGPNTVGGEILDRAEKGDLAGARHWLDWVRAELKLGGGEDPLSGPLLPRFWTKGQQGEKDAIIEAAASLLTTVKSDQRAIPILRAALDKAAEPDRPRYLAALAQAYSKRDKCTDLQPVAESLVKSFPESATAFGYLTEAFNCRQLWKQSGDAAEDRLKKLPDDPEAIRILARVAASQGNYADAERQLRRLIALGKAVTEDRNLIGWTALYHPPVPSQVMGDVLTGAGQDPPFSILHTIAMLYAEDGKTREARDVLRQAMDSMGMDEPESSIWLVVGRVAEDFDARDAALAAYGKVEKPKKEYQMSLSNYLLAQQRLAAMKK
jgi:tetratricopeptide (TPR) repeat protein